MKMEERRAAIAACKERKARSGIYGLRCQATGQRWFGRALDLDRIKNRLWFTLRQGNTPHRALQAAWNSHGPENFTFEIIESVEQEEVSYVRDRILKDRLAHWCAELGAAPI
ncbi:GIY-YIG nuclease family protein [Zavarzinia sp.]|uniref:GIY-YIG nuclease family protein n=1 Tax=Zavarzinia sp. TaxID=2027920 RepID=UPI003BB7974D